MNPSSAGGSDGLGDGELLGEGGFDAEALDDGDAEALGEVDELRDGETDALTDVEGDWLALGLLDSEMLALGLWDADGDAVGDGLALDDADGDEDTDADGDVLLDGLLEAEALADDDGDTDDDGETDGLTDGLALLDAEGDVELDGDGLGLAEALGDGLTEADGETDGDPVPVLKLTARIVLVVEFPLTSAVATTPVWIDATMASRTATVPSASRTVCNTPDGIVHVTPEAAICATAKMSSSASAVVKAVLLTDAVADTPVPVASTVTALGIPEYWTAKILTNDVLVLNVTVTTFEA